MVLADLFDLIALTGPIESMDLTDLMALTGSTD